MSIYGSKKSTIGIGHDGLPAFAQPGEAHEIVHHHAKGSTNQQHAAPGDLRGAAPKHLDILTPSPKRHTSVPLHSAFASEIKPDGSGLTGRGHSVQTIDDGAITRSGGSVDLLAKAAPESFKQGRQVSISPGHRSRTIAGGIEAINGILPSHPDFDKDCAS